MFRLARCDLTDSAQDQLADAGTPKTRRVRADSQRNLATLLQAAKAVFAASGVDAPVREIAERAAVGIGTVYRHFPQRADLVAAVFRNEIDACTEMAETLAAEYEPVEALERWMGRFADFISTKHGLASALHSGSPVFDALPAYFRDRLEPALAGLLRTAADAGLVRDDINADELLMAVAGLCSRLHDSPEQAQRMVTLLLDGLRYGAVSRA